MKKLLFLGLASALVLASFVPQAMAGKVEKIAKVDICHIISANDTIPFGPAPVWLYFGKEKSVAASAVPAHLDHGDSTTYWGGEAAATPINQFREAGANLPAADCYYGVKPDGSIVPLQ